MREWWGWFSRDLCKVRAGSVAAACDDVACLLTGSWRVARHDARPTVAQQYYITQNRGRFCTTVACLVVFVLAAHGAAWTSLAEYFVVTSV